MKYFCQQLDVNDCAYTCFRMILAISYRSHSFLIMKNPFCKSPVSLKEMKLEFEKYGIISVGVHVSLKNLSQVKVPFIVLLNKNGVGHYVVITKMIGSFVKVADGAKGVYWVSKRNFNESFSGKVLYFEKKKSKINIQIATIKIRGKFIRTMLYSISILCFFSGFYLFNQNSIIQWPIIAIGFGIITLLMHHYFLVEAMKDFDLQLFKEEQVCSYRLFELFIQLKKKWFSENYRFVENCVLLLAIIFLLTINDWWQLVVLSIVVFINLLTKQIQKAKTKKEIIDLENQETDWSNLKELTKESYFRFSLSTYRLANNILIGNIIKWFSLFVIVILYSALSGRVYINFLFFEIGMVTLFINAFDYVMGEGPRRIIREKLAASFINDDEKTR